MWSCLPFPGVCPPPSRNRLCGKERDASSLKAALVISILSPSSSPEGSPVRAVRFSSARSTCRGLGPPGQFFPLQVCLLHCYQNFIGRKFSYAASGKHPGQTGSIVCHGGISSLVIWPRKIVVRSVGHWMVRFPRPLKLLDPVGSYLFCLFVKLVLFGVNKCFLPRGWKGDWDPLCR